MSTVLALAAHELTLPVHANVACLAQCHSGETSRDTALAVSALAGHHSGVGPAEEYRAHLCEASQADEAEAAELPSGKGRASLDIWRGEAALQLLQTKELPGTAATEAARVARKIKPYAWTHEAGGGLVRIMSDDSRAVPRIEDRPAIIRA